MIIQFFARLVSVRTICYCENPRGCLEIIPKPSGICAYTPPTQMTTHAIHDEFLEKSRLYNTNGVQMMARQEGTECLLVLHHLHGRYLQVGTQDRNAYTQYTPYTNPSEETPPRPWSCRIRQKVLQPIEPCFVGGMAQHFGFAGTRNGTEEGAYIYDQCTPYVLDIAAAWSLEDIEPANNAPRLRGSLDVVDEQAARECMAFKNHVYVLGLKRVRNKDGKVNYNQENLVQCVPNPHLRTHDFANDYFGRWNGWIRYDLLPSILQSPVVGAPLHTEGTNTDFKMYDTAPFSKYPTPKALTIGNKYIMPLVTTTVTDHMGVWVETPSWRTDVTKVGYSRTPLLIDWPIVTYRASFGEKGNLPRPTVPIVFVPVMMKFRGSDGVSGPIDIKTGRRLCRGAFTFAIMTTDRPADVYEEKTQFSFTLHTISHPITTNPIFDPWFDLSGNHAALDAGVQIMGALLDGVVSANNLVVTTEEREKYLQTIRQKYEETYGSITTNLDTAEVMKIVEELLGIQEDKEEIAAE